MSRMLIIDGMSVMKTVVQSMVTLDNGMVYSFVTQMHSLITKLGDVRGVIVCWEGGHDFRAGIFPDYKKNRMASATGVHAQRDKIKALLSALGIDQIYAPGYEADDVGAFLSHTLNVPMVLQSNDKDWLQLIRPGVSVWQRPKTIDKKKTERMLLTHENFAEITGYPSTRDFLRAKCILGDGSDSIPGLTGVGEVTIVNWLCGRDDFSTRSKRAQEFSSSDQYARNMMLMDIMTPKPEIGPLLVWNRSEADEQRTLQLLEEYKFASILKKFPAWWEVIKKASL